MKKVSVIVVAVLLGSAIVTSAEPEPTLLTQLFEPLKTVEEVRCTRTFSDSIIRLEGTCEGGGQILGRGGFKLRDRTGEVWVASPVVPPKGAEVEVRGRVRQGARLPWGGQLLYVQGIGAPRPRER